MSILSGHIIRQLCTQTEGKQMVSPFSERQVVNGKSYGLSVAGYDIRIAEEVEVNDLDRFSLASSMERFKMPLSVIAFVKDKSTWARRGLSVFNTVIEPGWEGYLTLELAYHGEDNMLINAGDPIAQIIFQWVDAPLKTGYQGKYQNQEAGPQPARWEQIGEAQKISE